MSREQFSEAQVIHAVKLAENGKSVDNGLIESFNGRLRVEWFSTNAMYDAREKLELRRLDWNSRRTHSASGGLTPDEHATSQWLEVEHVLATTFPEPASVFIWERVTEDR